MLLCPSVRATLECCGDCMITQAGRGENQREKSKVPTVSELYYTMLDYGQGHHLVHTDPALHGSLTNPGSWKQMWSGSLMTSMDANPNMYPILIPPVSNTFYFGHHPTPLSQPTLPCSIHHLSSVIHHQWQLLILSLLNSQCLDFPNIQ